MRFPCQKPVTCILFAVFPHPVPCPPPTLRSQEQESQVGRPVPLPSHCSRITFVRQMGKKSQCLGATFSWDIRPQALGLLIQKMLSECPAHRKSISTICEHLSHNENHHPFLGTHVHAPWECLVFCCHLSVALDPSIQVGIELSMPLCGDAVRLLWFFLGKWIT